MLRIFLFSLITLAWFFISCTQQQRFIKNADNEAYEVEEIFELVLSDDDIKVVADSVQCVRIQLKKFPNISSQHCFISAKPLAMKDDFFINNAIQCNAYYHSDTDDEAVILLNAEPLLSDYKHYWLTQDKVASHNALYKQRLPISRPVPDNWLLEYRLYLNVYTRL